MNPRDAAPADDGLDPLGVLQLLTPAQLMATILGAKTATRELVVSMRLGGKEGCRTVYRYTSPAGSLTTIRSNTDLEVQWGEEAFVHYQPVGKGWVVTETSS